MASMEQNLNGMEPYTKSEQIVAANGNTLYISSIGSVALTTPHNQSLTHSNVYFVPHVFANLLSIGQLVDNSYSVHFPSSSFI